MAFFQIDLQEPLKLIDQDSLQFQHRPALTKETIKQNFIQFLQTKYDNLIQEGDQLTDMTLLLQNILTLSDKLKSQFEQSQKLQRKLRDIEEELQNYFQCKLELQDVISDYIASFEQFIEIKKDVKTISEIDLPREQTLNRLQEYSCLIKKLAEYTTFESDLGDLKKIEQRFRMLELEEDYLEYQLMINNKIDDQIKQSPTQLLCLFVQMLGQSIKSLKSHLNCPIIILLDDHENITEELLIQYKQTILLKIQNKVPALILIDKEQQNGQSLCISQNRQSIKLYLDNYKNYLSNIKISYVLLKNELILEQIFSKIIEKLIEINIINQSKALTFQEMLQNIQKILKYQEGLQELDCFQFLDYMYIELN
ncbi:unnamed protein product [Paramecium sonneborni]|uniref:Uncharacterized protein n=1 Tax=Paramecium sonneborni TaxID=65129 RepID=A0A8S1NW62_9CILI|nr:unnamed protein product [Paramecium sonneborni]